MGDLIQPKSLCNQIVEETVKKLNDEYHFTDEMKNIVLDLYQKSGLTDKKKIINILKPNTEK